MSRRRAPAESPVEAGQLSSDEVQARFDAYKEPAGHPQGTVFRLMPDSRHIRELKDLFDGAGVVPYLERKLRASGSDSRLTVLALLVAMFYVAGEWGSYWRTHMSCFLASLHPQDAVDLGIQTLGVLLKPISYSVVCKQAKRLENALREGWTDEDGTHCNLRWFNKCIIEASVPPDIASQVQAVAMDATDIPSWNNGTQADEHGRHGLDPDASPSHRSGNSERPSSGFHGYFLTVCIAVKTWRMTRSDTQLAFGPSVPAYAVSMMLETAGAGVAQTGSGAMDEACEHCPNINKSITDRGYSQLGPTFNRYIHGKGIEIVMDYKSTMLESAKPVRLGPSNYPAFFHAGTFLHAYTPPNWRIPPPGLKGKELKKFYSERAKRFGLTVNKNLPDGGKQFSSPVRGGRLNIDPDRRTAVHGQPFHLPPADLKEIFGSVPDEIFHQELINVPVEQLDYHQTIPWGTPLHKQVYGKRNPSENSFSQTKEEYALHKKTNRVSGIASRNIMCLARLAWYNLRISRKIEASTKAEKQARRAANKTRPKTHAAARPDDSAQQPSSEPANGDPDSPARPPPPT